MNCPECQELLQSRLDGQPVPDRAALDRHLASCPECRERHAAAQVLADGLRALPRPEASPDLARRVAARVLRDRAARLRRRRIGVGLALAASLLLGVGAYFWLASPGTEQPTAEAPAPKPKVEERPAPVPPPPKKAGPSLRESVGQTREALAALVERIGEATREQTRVLQNSSLQFVSLDSMSQVAPLAQPLDATAEALRQTGRGVSAGMSTVSGSARRALNYFLRKTPPLQASPKRPAQAS
jgi:anti-sigma factor RsiW